MLGISAGRRKSHLVVESKMSHSAKVDGRLENETKTLSLWTIQAHRWVSWIEPDRRRMSLLKRAQISGRETDKVDGSRHSLHK